MPTSNSWLSYPSLKRTLDLTLALLAISVAMPLLILISTLLWITQGRPIFFVQTRPGLDTRLFKLWKFRTMSPAGPNSINDLSRQSITPLGKLLRKLSADELPQLLNIVRGDMSFVGPRPLLVEYLPLYSPRQSLRHTVRPGLTGLAQVNGRNSQSWNDRLEMDAFYAENISWPLDLSIVVRSIWTVLSAKGVSPRGSQLMEHFQGDHNNPMTG
jgi:lipopolysaccharide/colanic/teichoic acid biosynthesis glycosyltransferase